MKISIKQSLWLLVFVAGMQFTGTASPSVFGPVPYAPQHSMLPIFLPVKALNITPVPPVPAWLDQVFYDSYNDGMAYFEWYRFVVRYYAPLSSNVKIRYTVHSEYYYSGNPVPYSISDTPYEAFGSSGTTSTDLGVFETTSQDVYYTTYTSVYLNAVDPI